MQHKGCRIAMLENKPCGRSLHTVPDYDEQPVCLMHSRDPTKSSSEFDAEIMAILSSDLREQSQASVSDFTKFVFLNYDFRSKLFTEAAHFRGATFTKAADFIGATFTGAADFSGATFTGAAHFSGATFTEAADFIDATFTGAADFIGATFTGAAHFGWATFTEAADFIGATFTGAAHFSGATFTGAADFGRATFTGPSSFENVTFHNAVHFDDARFRAVADFHDVSFVKPDLVRFLRTNKDTTPGLRIRFVNCRMEGIQLEAVGWYRPNNRLVLQDESDILEPYEKPPSYEEVATAYRRLITNFEKARAYDLSDDCTIGEFDMKRRNPDQFIFAEWLGPIYERYPRLRKCIGKQLSIVDIYRWASVYGTSYCRALIVLGSLLLFFGLGYATIAKIAPSSLCTNEIFACGQRNSFEVLCGGVLHSLETATLQRTPFYKTGSVLGYVMEMLEQILVAGQAALLLFALRRRFRR